ncbi:hypothetical protein VSA01S_10180 [Vibrio sagamiensis NBRC 104589]|uniref:Uncharacterized protein n=1 Tax=Vibrio sagamiensis NBRC 104589 TaxID=1219064 RepID=A0A511QCF8_9VIBR|nr:hypothetical protein VSA01S_10180 [Vibrio sagamiensis NBRC 104589]
MVGFAVGMKFPYFLLNVVIKTTEFVELTCHHVVSGELIPASIGTIRTHYV